MVSSMSSLRPRLGPSRTSSYPSGTSRESKTFFVAKLLEVTMSKDGSGNQSETTTKILDWRTGEVLAELRGHSGSVTAIQFEPDRGSWLALTWGEKSLLEVRDTRQGGTAPIRFASPARRLDENRKVAPEIALADEFAESLRPE